MFSLSALLGTLAGRGQLTPSGSLGNVKQVVTTLNSGGKLLEMVKTVLPPLTYSQHKGEAGRIAIIGGSQEYTGAPYFAAISALKVGGDLSHVFCCSDSASGIQSYSPDLIVHPLLDRPHAVSQISEWLTRMHSLVIGPGLGRNHTVLQNVKEIILKAQEMDIPIVIDADGLYLVTQEPGVIENYKKAVLTPNEVEFARLFRKVLNDDPREDEPVSDVSLLASALGNVTLVRKGLNDIICDGDNVLVCCGEGSPRRCGGQGDLLSGSMGTFIYWAHRAAQKEQTDPSLELYGPAICAAFGACSLIKECNRQAFQKHRRSTTTTDMVEHIQAAFEQLYT
ncbi:ATP-dependent (S)-NAD(P)H-hydrate dehydratase-like isoform X2 [Liolophura sinensis]|uniref:ATP-dependent (S)-NAD(P)H-hydrate dehydratase-like isoform X2 n=1 Tax=Liolophura sinensis TaxID=3198878 RepID=UPI0031596F3E